MKLSSAPPAPALRQTCPMSRCHVGVPALKIPSARTHSAGSEVGVWLLARLNGTCELPVEVPHASEAA